MPPQFPMKSVAHAGSETTALVVDDFWGMFYGGIFIILKYAQ
jgi:hypothetical protein